MLDDTDDGADVTAAVDGEPLRDATAGDNRFVEAVACEDVCAGTVGSCGMASGIED
jgi:hypothetical protein